MSNKLYEESDVQAIANAIRTKNGSSDTYMVSEMAQAVLDIPTGTTPTGTKQVTIDSAGTTTENVSAYANVEITVPQGSVSASGTVTANPTITVNSDTGRITANVDTIRQSFFPTITEGWVSTATFGAKAEGTKTYDMGTESAKTITPSTQTQRAISKGVFAIGNVDVAPIPSEYVIPTGKLTINQNGTDIDVSQYASVDVNVSGGQTYTHLLEYLEVTPTSNLTSSNQLQIQLQSGYANAIVLIMCLDTEYVTDPVIYKAVYAIKGFGIAGQSVTAILRPAGTIGTDNGMMVFNPTTGIMTLGGQYGTFMAGSTYAIYHWEMGAKS